MAPAHRPEWDKAAGPAPVAAAPPLLILTVSSFIACHEQDKAARHASMTAAFCERLGWYDLEALIAKFQVRVQHPEHPSATPIHNGMTHRRCAMPMLCVSHKPAASLTNLLAGRRTVQCCLLSSAAVHAACSVVPLPHITPASPPTPIPQGRVLHGVRPEILALSEIPFVKAYTARLLYRAGLRCVGVPGRRPLRGLCVDMTAR